MKRRGEETRHLNESSRRDADELTKSLFILPRLKGRMIEMYREYRVSNPDRKILTRLANTFSISNISKLWELPFGHTDAHQGSRQHFIHQRQS